jgi:NADH-quinone oxidoreductase subunit J
VTLPFSIIAILTIAAAVAAMSLRNLVHCSLALTVAFAGLAAAFLQLDAQFVGFAQILVYVGAVAILIVFASADAWREAPERPFFASWFWGIVARPCFAHWPGNHNSFASQHAGGKVVPASNNRDAMTNLCCRWKSLAS